MSNGTILLIVVSFHHTCAEALRRRPCHSVARHHLSLAEKGALFSGGKEITILIFVSLLSFLGPYCSFLFVVLSHPTCTEELRRCPRAIIFPWLREGRPLLSRKRKHHFDCCFFVVFPWLHARAEALQRRQDSIVLCD